jgi:hypothetical protein
MLRGRDYDLPYPICVAISFKTSQLEWPWGGRILRLVS